MRKIILILTILVFLCGCAVGYFKASGNDNRGIETQKTESEIETETEVEINIDEIDEPGGMVCVETYAKDGDDIKFVEQNFYYDENNQLYKREDIYHFVSEAAAKMAFGTGDDTNVIVDENIVTLKLLDSRNEDHTFEVSGDVYEEMIYTYESHRKEEWKNDETFSELVSLYGLPEKIVVTFMKD